jgi:menaquinone-dependent protoporphyrinogen oxidase
MPIRLLTYVKTPQSERVQYRGNWSAPMPKKAPELNTDGLRRVAIRRLAVFAAAGIAATTGLAWWATRRPPTALVQGQCKGEVMNTKVLVAYATRAGSTGEIADAIGRQLCAEGFEADVKEVSAVASLEGYAAVVLGSAVRYGNWLPEMLSFIQRHKAALDQRPLACFTACNKAKDQSVASLNEMKTYSRAARDVVEPKSEAFLAGKLDPATLSWLDRLAVKVIGSPYGDFRDWTAIKVWAKSLAPLLQRAAG